MYNTCGGRGEWRQGGGVEHEGKKNEEKDGVNEEGEKQEGAKLKKKKKKDRKGKKRRRNKKRKKGTRWKKRADRSIGKGWEVGDSENMGMSRGGINDEEEKMR